MLKFCGFFVIFGSKFVIFSQYKPKTSLYFNEIVVNFVAK